MNWFTSGTIKVREALLSPFGGIILRLPMKNNGITQKCFFFFMKFIS